jgi:hypothetical protein
MNCPSFFCGLWEKERNLLFPAADVPVTNFDVATGSATSKPRRIGGDKGRNKNSQPSAGKPRPVRGQLHFRGFLKEDPVCVFGIDMVGAQQDSFPGEKS